MTDDEPKNYTITLAQQILERLHPETFHRHMPPHDIFPRVKARVLLSCQQATAKISKSKLRRRRSLLNLLDPTWLVILTVPKPDFE